MSVTLSELQTTYANELTEQYEYRQSMLRGMVHTRMISNANTYSWIVDSKAPAARTRGANGDIPLSDIGQYNVKVSMTEYHCLLQINDFSVLTANVDQRLSMQRRAIASINQTTDQLILTEMATTTYTTGSAAAMSLSLAMTAIEMLYANEVENDGRIYALVTPRAWSLLLNIAEFSSTDWVSDQPFMKGYKGRDWLGVKWMLYSRLPGRGTNAAKCFMWHQDSIGHAMNGADIQTSLGYEDKQARSWFRATSYQGSKLILPPGMILINHDDTAAIA